jgi:hypothetical protein
MTATTRTTHVSDRNMRKKVGVNNEAQGGEHALQLGQAVLALPVSLLERLTLG